MVTVYHSNIMIYKYFNFLNEFEFIKLIIIITNLKYYTNL